MESVKIIFHAAWLLMEKRRDILNTQVRFASLGTATVMIFDCFTEDYKDMYARSQKHEVSRCRGLGDNRVQGVSLWEMLHPYFGSWHPLFRGPHDCRAR
jgi:hypothetical protein